MEVVEAITQSPLPTILAIGGIAFIFFAVVGKVGGKIILQIPESGQRWLMITGGALVVLGIFLYILPFLLSRQGTISAPTPTPTSTPMPVPTNTPIRTSIPMPTDTSSPIPANTPTPAPTPTYPSVALLTYHSRYVTAMNGEGNRDWVLRAETNVLSDWEKFALLCLDDGKVALKTYHSRYVTAMNDEGNRDWVLRAETNVLSDWEKFTLVEPETEQELLCSDVFILLKQGSIRIALKTHHGRYVTAMNDEGNQDWVLRAETKTLSDWEKFTVIPLP